MKIFLIDDDVGLIRALRRTLRDFDVTIEHDGTVAAAKIEAADRDGVPYDFVVCDYHLKGITGIEILQAIRRLPQPPRFILMSGQDLEPDVVAADGVLAKPFSTTMLRTLVEEIRHKRAEATTQSIPKLSTALCQSI